MAAPSKYTAAEKTNHISSWRVSGISQKEYCAQHDLKYQTFCRWVYKSREDNSSIEETKNIRVQKNFIPIRVTENISSQKSIVTKVELEFPDGTKLRIN